VTVEHEADLHTALALCLDVGGGQILEKKLQCTCYFLSSIQTTGLIGRNEE